MRTGSPPLLDPPSLDAGTAIARIPTSIATKNNETMAHGVQVAFHREGTHSIGKRFIDVPQKASGNVMLIKKHDKSDIVELEEGSGCRVRNHNWSRNRGRAL
jgi:hypothetical protein